MNTHALIISKILLFVIVLFVSGCCVIGERVDGAIDGWKDRSGVFLDRNSLPENVRKIERDCYEEERAFDLLVQDRWCEKAERTGNYKEYFPEYGWVPIEEKMRAYCPKRPPIPEKWKNQEPRNFSTCMSENGYTQDSQNVWHCNMHMRLF
jgi:hypothetical protein